MGETTPNKQVVPTGETVPGGPTVTGDSVGGASDLAGGAGARDGDLASCAAQGGDTVPLHDAAAAHGGDGNGDGDTLPLRDAPLADGDSEPLADSAASSSECPAEVSGTLEASWLRAVRDEAPGTDAPQSAAVDASSAPGGSQAPAADGAGPVDPGSAGTRPEPAPRRRLGRRAAIAIVAACVVALVAAVAVITYSLQLWGGRPIPDVTGLAVADATARLEDAGLAVDRTQVPTDEGAGTVLTLDPPAGTRVGRGSTVTAGVGVPRVVPDVRGASLDDAKARLAQAGIESLRLEYRNSDEPEGTVTDVSPAKGSVVTADDEATLIVAQPYTVPDVVGLSQDDATKAIGEAGLDAKIEWQESEGSALTVLSTSPAAGERTSAGATVTVTVVAPGARSETYLADYLSAAPRDVSSYLSWKGWSFEFGVASEKGGDASAPVAETAWTKRGVGRLVLTASPESSRHGSFLGSLLTSDVLAQGAAIKGVRFEPELSGDDANPSADSATVNAWARRCGLTGLSQTLSGNDIAEAAGRSGQSSGGIVGYGEMGDDVWAVAVTRRGEVAVAVAPASLYEGVDLSGYGNSLAVYLGYQMLYE